MAEDCIATCENTSGTTAVCDMVCAGNVCWQDAPVISYPWLSADYYCDGLSLGGHTDWHLPTRQEFIDVLGGCDAAILGGNAGLCNSCAASATCTELFGSDTDWYWSSSPYDPGGAWRASFRLGVVPVGDVGTDDGYVRCVRSGP